MIQDIAPHRYDNAYRPVPPRPEDYALYFTEHQALLRRKDEEIDFPRFGNLENRNDDIYENVTYLFQIDGRRFYLAEHVNLEPLSGTMPASPGRSAAPFSWAFSVIWTETVKRFIWMKTNWLWPNGLNGRKSR